MNDGKQSAITPARRLVRDLRALGQAYAPDTLVPAVRVQLGLGDLYFPLSTPLGEVFVAYNDVGISAVMRAESRDAFAQAFHARYRRPVSPTAEPPETLVDSVRRQLRGERRSGLRFDLRGLSEFERAVLLKALEIPYGEVRPYAWVAREIGHPKAVRAVGTALAHNPIPLLIPCHRVVRSDGHIGQYGLGGPSAKSLVLTVEGAQPDMLASLAHSGVRYIGSDTTHIYCFPTCRHARRVTPKHRVQFGSDAEAADAGYRPCQVCRPA